MNTVFGVFNANGVFVGLSSTPEKAVATMNVTYSKTGCVYTLERFKAYRTLKPSDPQQPTFYLTELTIDDNHF